MARVTNSLGDGLVVLRDAFSIAFTATLKVFGLDSMLLPVAVLKSETNTNQRSRSIRSSKRSSMPQIVIWAWRRRLVHVAGQLRLPDSALPGRRAAGWRSAGQRPTIAAGRSYRGCSGCFRGRASALVMFRLFPLAISIAVAIAFGDHPTEEMRAASHLAPSIADCRPRPPPQNGENVQLHNPSEIRLADAD